MSHQVKHNYNLLEAIYHIFGHKTSEKMTKF